ncbi:ribosome small subunit-stimulated GTPase EngC [Lachnospiraceae bacterium KM106-2]|nr:ribosome small subunit-stimulated GTPase EngC [Lachnospiraceae bacterium KM106-2]
MQGKIIKGIGGFYYIHIPEHGVYECRAKGIFRKDKKKPLVGDNVEIDIIDEDKKVGNVVSILERKNELIRPAVSNVDQALVIFAAVKPAPNLNLLDRFLIMMERQNVETIVCFNKRDIATQEELDRLKKTYESAGYQVYLTSAAKEEGIDELREAIEGKTTVLAGPSGVGKSSIINLIDPHAHMETGQISTKIERGKHTTRHSELFSVNETTYIFDTPGFSSLYIEDMEKEELQEFFIEFAQYEPNCKFQGCSHINEPVCGVKDALSEGKISQIRYDNYVQMYDELSQKKKYK